MRRKGALSLPSDLAAILFLAFVIILFSYVFFFVGLTDSREITIDVDQQYVSSSTLMTLLRTPITAEETRVSRILTDNFKEGEEYDGAVIKPVQDLLAKLPRPSVDKTRDPYAADLVWYLVVKRLPGGKITDSAEGATYVRGTDAVKEFEFPFFLSNQKQSTVIPLRKGEGTLLVVLYLAPKSGEDVSENFGMAAL